jgi:hypothetical protein
MLIHLETPIKSTKYLSKTGKKQTVLTLSAFFFDLNLPANAKVTPKCSRYVDVRKTCIYYASKCVKMVLPMVNNGTYVGHGQLYKYIN